VEIEFRAKHLHTNLPKTNQKEKLRYDMCISCWLTVTSALNIATGEGIRIDYFGNRALEKLLTFAKTNRNRKFVPAAESDAC